MSMNKVIHGAVRRDLRRFLGALDRLRPGDTALAGRIAVAWDQFEDQLRVHHTGEHEIAWPALLAVGTSPALLAELDTEHAAMAAALADAAAGFAGLRREPTAGRITATRDAVARLQDVTVSHLDHEESEIEELYLASHDRPEILAMNKEFAKVSPARGGRFFAWVTDGATPDELATVKDSVPGPVLAVIGGIFGRSYRRQIGSLWTELGLTGS